MHNFLMHCQFAARSSIPTHRCLRLEQLESRLALSVTTAIADGNWSDPGTWNNGVPTLSDDVVIPTTRTVLLDGAVSNAQTLLIHGTLQASENGVANKSLVSDWILVDGGFFQVGSAIDPYDTNTLTVTLEGDNPNQNLPLLGITSNNAFLMVRAGGTLQLFGEVETSWTQLNATASGGASSITLKEAVTWNPGDEIVIASTTFDMNEAETRTITSLSGDRMTVEFNTPLTYSHYGELQFYDDGNGTNYELDERAEVGLLTRSIKIQGDADSTVDGIGGNLMFMETAGQISIDGVEFYHMGQKAQLGRYPVHWHKAGDRTGDFVKNSSIHRAFNRALTIHGAHNILIEQNVAYDHIGHGFFLEDAVETGNKFYYNLGLVTREPLLGEELLPSDLGPKDFQISGPGTFWITNPDNELVGNVAGGSQTGSGFWYALPTGPLGPSASDPQYFGVNPQTTALGLFQGNRAHSNAIGLDVDGGPNVVTQIAEIAHYSPPTIADFQDFTAFANSKNGVYYRGTDNIYLSNARLGDNFQDVQFAFGQTLRDSLLVGRSDNIFPGARRGFSIYDGPNIVQNVHFAGYSVAANAHVFFVFGANQRNANAKFQGITFDTPSPFVFEDSFENNNLSRHWGFSLYDVDGSLTGTAGLAVVYDHPMMRSNGDSIPAGWLKAVLSPYRFGHLRLIHGLDPAQQPTVTIDRIGGPGTPASHTDIPMHEAFTQIGAVMNTDFVYTVTYNTPLNSDFINLEVSDLIQPTDYIYARVLLPSTWNSMSGSNAVELFSELSVRNSSQSAFYIDYFNNTAFIKLVGTNNVQLDRLDTPPPSFAPADFNEDSAVDGTDLNALEQGFGTVGTATKSQGDADLDLDVDGSDFLMWQRQFQASSVQTNLLLNEDFSANAAAFTLWPGYADDGTNPAIDNWVPLGPVFVGINGPNTGFAGEPFAPSNTTGIDNFAFIQGGNGAGRLVQPLLTLDSNQEYSISFDAASRAGNSAIGRVWVADDASTIFDSLDITLNSANFESFSFTFTTPSVLGTPGTGSVSLWQKAIGDSTAVYANVRLVESSAASPALSASATQSSMLTTAQISAQSPKFTEEYQTQVSEPLTQNDLLSADGSFFIVTPKSPSVLELRSKTLSLLRRQNDLNAVSTLHFEGNEVVQQSVLTTSIEAPSLLSKGHPRSTAIRAADDFFARLGQEELFGDSLLLLLPHFI